MISASSLSATRVAPQFQSMLRSIQERRARTAVDRELARRIHAAVEGAKLDARGLSIYVHDGSVALYGSVHTERVRDQVLRLVSEQPGAKRITDHLQLPGA